MTANTEAAPAQAQQAPEGHSQLRETLSVLFSNKLAIAGAVVIVLLVLAAVLGPWLAPYSPTAIAPADRLQPPSGAHWFGTDELGRDVFSRVLVASRISLLVGFVAVGIALLVGVPIGLVAGFYRGRADDALMRFMDMLFAFPPILLAIAVVAVLGPGVTNAMIGIGVVTVPIFARITRSSVLSVREEVFVRAARSLGAGDLRLITRHILPNVLAPIIVQTTVYLAFAILNEAALAFLGLGAQPPTPTWGRMLYEGRGFMEQAWWMAVFPGVAIFVVVLAFNVLGDALRDALDPRQKSAIQAGGR